MEFDSSKIAGWQKAYKFTTEDSTVGVLNRILRNFSDRLLSRPPAEGCLRLQLLFSNQNFPTSTILFLWIPHGEFQLERFEQMFNPLMHNVPKWSDTL